ncbi:hypothetical protein HDU86_003813 [Geranomyces michiganensis]|nr:hypothetical protein HDU86_003813 [Geranomyces michiganensis]
MVLVLEWPLRNIHYHGLPLSELRTVADPTTSTKSPLAPGTDPAYPLLYPRAAASRARSLQLEQRVIKELDGDFPGLTSAQRSAVLSIVAESERVRAECKGMDPPSEIEEDDDNDAEFPVIMRELKEAPDVPSALRRGAGAQSMIQKYSQFQDRIDPQSLTLRPPAQLLDTTTSSTFSSSGANSMLASTAGASASAGPSAPQSSGPTNEMHRVLTSLGQWVHAMLDVPTLFLPDSVAPPPIPQTEFDTLLAGTAPSMLTPAAIVVAAPERRHIVLEDNPPDVLRRMVPPPPEPLSAAGRRSARRQRAAAAAPIGPAPILAADGKMDAKLKRDAARDAARLPPAKSGRRAGNWAQGYGKWYVRPTLWNAFMQKSEAERARHTQQANTPAQHHRQISTLIHVKLTEIAVQRAKEEQALLAYAAQGAAPAATGSMPGTATTGGGGGGLDGTHPVNSRRSSLTSVTSDTIQKK